MGNVQIIPGNMGKFSKATLEIPYRKSYLYIEIYDFSYAQQKSVVLWGKW